MSDQLSDLKASISAAGGECLCGREAKMESDDDNGSLLVWHVANNETSRRLEKSLS